MLKFGDLFVEINHKTIKHIYLRVDAPSKKVIVSAPKRFSQKEVLAIVEEKEPWIRKRIQESSMSKEKPFLIFGKEVVTLFEIGGTSSFKEGLLTLGIKEDSLEEKEKRKELFLRKLLKDKVLDLLEEIKGETGLEAQKVTIKKMKTRWGSINRKTGSLNINLLLIHKEEWVIRSVLYHELAHLKLPGHQRGFYHYLSKLDKNYKEAKKELRG